MTEQDIKRLGFEMTKQYEHDQYTTRRYQKGALEVEFTYEEGELVSNDLTITEVNCLPISLKQLEALTPILGNQ